VSTDLIDRIHSLFYVYVLVHLLNLGAGDMVPEIPTRLFTLHVLESESLRLERTS